MRVRVQGTFPRPPQAAQIDVLVDAETHEAAYAGRLARTLLAIVLDRTMADEPPTEPKRSNP